MPVVLYVLFVVAILPYLASVTGLILRVKQFGRLDNHHPRLQQQLQQQTPGPGARANSAQANSWEALAVFTVAVVVAHASGLPLEQLDAAAIAFLAIRLVYLAVYLLNLAALRTAVFAAGMGCCVYIVYLAASYVGG